MRLGVSSCDYDYTNPPPQKKVYILVRISKQNTNEYFVDEMFVYVHCT